MGVVVSSNYVVPSGADYNANSPAILIENIVTIDNVVVSNSTQAAFPAENLANPATDLLWKGNSASVTQTITVTPASASPVDAVGIVGHNFNTANIQVKIRGDQGAGYSDLTSYVVPSSDGPIMFFLAPGVSYTNLRVSLVVGTTTPQIASIFMGRMIRLQRRLYVNHTPITMGERVDRVTGRGLNGAYLGSVVRGESRESRISLANLTPGWYREVLDPFIEAAKTSAFFWAWRPSTYPSEVGYCWIKGNPQPVNQRANGMMQVDIDVEGVA